MADLFGGPVGEMAYDRNQLVKAETQKTLAETAGQPAVNRLRSAQAGLAEMELAEEQRWVQMLTRQASGADAAGAVDKDGKPKPLSEIYDGFARAALQAGAPNKASEFAKAAGTLKAQEASAVRGQALAELNSMKAERQKIDLTARLLDDVKDDAGWNRAQLLYQAMTGEKSIYAGLPYSKDLVDRIRSAGQSVKDQIAAREKKAEDDSRARARTALTAHRKKMEDLTKQRLDLEKAREDRLAKTGGGKQIVSPTKLETDQAIRLINEDFPKIEGSDRLNAAYQIASEARALRHTNPALDANQAIQQAYNTAKDRGDFKEIVEKGFFSNTTRQKFQSPYRVTPAPADVKDRVYGRSYSNDQGRVAKWTKEGWVPLDLPALDEGDDEDEGDDDNADD